jgi:2-hydroxy-3-keto-5-methylthiopentenyl-1-phosphate phosphatase
MTPHSAPTQGGVLVSDFDGTMTRHDFYKLALESLLPPGTPDYWARYRTGELTHFEALRRYFAAIRVGRAEAVAVADRMELDPDLPAAVTSLREAGWKVVVASAGCDWYIRHLLDGARVDVEVNANPGRFETGRGLLMELPVDSPYLSSTLGIDKARIVRRHLDDGRTVAFAGDGFPDAEPARLVPGNLRFARGDLADVLGREGLPYHPFANWSDVTRILLQQGA